EEGDRRYDDDSESAHVMLFIVDDDTLIDGGRHGNDARFINHSCSPNCEATEENGRIFIRSLRTIHEGEELSYDYQLSRTDYNSSRYPCYCGASKCRGTMLESA